MAATLPVTCTFCNKIIYDYSGPTDRVVLDAAHFAPRRGFEKPSATTGLVCPHCGERWVAVSLQIDGLRMAVDPTTRGSGVVKY